MSTGLKLYRSKEHADHWIGEDRHGALLIFPAKVRGWISRTPFAGSRLDLEEVSPVLARGTKWPGAIGGKPRDPSGKPSRTVGIRATDDERAAWQRAADASGTGLTDWARRSLNQVAARATPKGARAKRSKGKP
jgi:hypothetical protein